MAALVMTSPPTAMALSIIDAGGETVTPITTTSIKCDSSIFERKPIRLHTFSSFQLDFTALVMISQSMGPQGVCFNSFALAAMKLRILAILKFRRLNLDTNGNSSEYYFGQLLQETMLNLAPTFIKVGQSLSTMRSIEIRIKKRVKQQYTNGKFHDLMTKVIANPKTLQDAYDCVRTPMRVLDVNL